jgi:hypothetical protein
LVRHEVSAFTFTVLYLPEGAKVIDGSEKANGQVLFTKLIADLP